MRKNCTHDTFLVHRGNILFYKKKMVHIFGTIATITEYGLLEKKKGAQQQITLSRKKWYTSMIKKQDFLFRQNILYIFWVQNNIFNIHFLQQIGTHLC